MPGRGPGKVKVINVPGERVLWPKCMKLVSAWGNDVTEKCAKRMEAKKKKRMEA